MTSFGRPAEILTSAMTPTADQTLSPLAQLASACVDIVFRFFQAGAGMIAHEFDRTDGLAGSDVPIDLVIDPLGQDDGARLQGHSFCDPLSGWAFVGRWRVGFVYALMIEGAFPFVRGGDARDGKESDGQPRDDEAPFQCAEIFHIVPFSF